MKTRETNISPKIRRIAVWALLAAPFVIGTGCASMGAPAPSIEVVHNHQPDDVPIPQHFTYDEQASWAYLKFQDARIPMRSMQLVYWGDRPVQELEAWYRNQMKLHGWVYETADQLGETRLVFSKGPESAEILMKRTPDKNGRYYVTRLVARVGVK